MHAIEDGLTKDQRYYRKNRERLRANRRLYYQRNKVKERRSAVMRKHKNRSSGDYSITDWERLLNECRFRCGACGRLENREDPLSKLTPDHVIPVVLGGTNTIDNIQVLCYSCNSSKQGKTIDFRETSCLHGTLVSPVSESEKEPF